MAAAPKATIDLRTDVVTGPTDNMWDAMRSNQFGWAYVEEDATVHELQSLGAQLLGKEACVFVPTAGAGNLAALMTLGPRGTQALVESTSHIVVSESWNIASVASLFPRLFDAPGGVIDIAVLGAAVEEAKGFGLPPTSVVCLENTHTRWGGTTLSPSVIQAVCSLSHNQGAKVHMDGARLFNAAAALGVPISGLAAGVDTVVVSLNKGLSAPYGALLAGSEQIISEARVNLRRIGAWSVHKSGIFAAAGIVALTQMTERIGEDNRRAAELARGLSEIPGLRVETDPPQTNIVLLNIAGLGCETGRFVHQLAARGVRVLARSATQVRLVTHRLIGDPEVDRTIAAVTEVAGILADQQSNR